MIHSIYSEKANIQHLASRLDKVTEETPLDLQYIYSNHLVLRTAGFMENSTQAIFKEYCKNNANPKIANYVEHHISRLNSLNSDKLESLIKLFDESYWQKVVEHCDTSDLSALDSIKAIRDKIAHGQSNGTGIKTIIQYFESTIHFFDAMELVLAP